MIRLHFLLLLLVISRVGFAGPVRQYLQTNSLDEGLRACRQFETMGNVDKDNLFACGWIYFRTNRLESAQKVLEKTRKFSSLPEYQLLLAMDKLKNNRYEEAKRISENVSKEYRGSAIGLSAQELSAEVYELQGKLDPAAFIYKQVISDDPKRGRAHWGLGRYYLSHGDTGRAKVHLEETSRLWPRHVGSRFNLGLMAMTDNNLGEAVRWFNEAYKLDRSDAGVLEQLGLVFEKKGMINDAIRYWRRAAEVKKDSTIAKEKLANYVSSTVDALLASKQWKEALKQMLVGEKTMSSDPQYLMKRGMVYRNLGQWDKAATDLMAYTNGASNDGTALRELGVCYLNLKLPDRAAEYFGRAITVEPSNGMNYAWMGYVLEGKNNLPMAREAWAKALELLRDPVEISRATRRLTSVEARLNKRAEKKKKQEEEED